MNFDSCHVFSGKVLQIYCPKFSQNILAVCDTLPETCPRFCLVLFSLFLEKILGRDRMGLPFSSGPGRGGACTPAHKTVMKRK